MSGNCKLKKRIYEENQFIWKVDRKAFLFLEQFTYETFAHHLSILVKSERCFSVDRFQFILSDVLLSLFSCYANVEPVGRSATNESPRARITHLKFWKNEAIHNLSEHIIPTEISEISGSPKLFAL